ncbi:MAG: 30S ribosomal protein S9 [Patescibacteria group bacterium]|nr:MAG: 30S ribosomal protein S9 [Patescibacteria group bacterium]
MEAQKQEKTKGRFYQAVGRRKEATAAVRLFKGKGEFMVNGQAIQDYFPSDSEKSVYGEPFRVAEMEGKFHGTVKVQGGGKGGQLGAVALGFARALIEFDEKLRKPLRDAGLLTRDARVKERKKYFLRKARKRPQYSKR